MEELTEGVLKAALLCFCVAISSCGRESENDIRTEAQKMDKYQITVYDSDYAQSMSRVYEVDTGMVEVRAVGHLVNEVPEVLFDRKLTDDERQLIGEFLNSFPLNKLKSTYITPYVQDGDQKLFVISLGALRKRVKVSNYYQEDLGSIVNLINQLIPTELWITYPEDSTEIGYGD